MIRFPILYFLLWQAACCQMNLTGPSYVRRHEAIHVICCSNQTPVGLTADFLVNGITYSSLRSTENGCYSAHLRTRCPSRSAVCHCDRDGKEYGLLIHASVGTSTMTVLCIMTFQNGGHILQSDALIVKIYDPPSLSIHENVQCNLSSSVEIVCDSLGGSVIYDDWFHSYNGILMKKMKGAQIGNRSTISIGSCGIEDTGEYMCKAGYTIQNETFWANVTTSLKVDGPPIAFGTLTTTKPTKFIIIFYSSTQATLIKWSKDQTTLGNASDFELMTHRHNISVDTDGMPMVLTGFRTSLATSRRSPGVYTVLLKNDFGEYYHQFLLPAGIRGFSLQTFMWILICVAVFLINSTIATIIIRRRGRRFLKSVGNTGTVGIYYAAPSTETTSQYNSTRLQNEANDLQEATGYEESRLYTEIIDEQVQQEESDETSHHYIELE